MRLALRGRAPMWRAVAAFLAALLWCGLSPGAWLSTAHADGGRSSEPGIAAAWGENNGGALGDGSTVLSSTSPNAV
ncbi:hypothetical protein Scel_51490 [Streptomyces cellostaticus]|nr:hypothetical protein Scel_51490 [Streptomyces cellostaticus]